MLEIKVTVELPGIPEALTDLADSIRGSAIIPMAKQPAMATAPVVTDEVRKPRRSSKAKEADVPVKEDAPKAQDEPSAFPAVEEEATEAAKPIAEPAKQESNTTQYTLDQISKAGIALMDQGKVDSLFGLLDKYGIQSLTAADPKTFNALAADLMALGAVFEKVNA